MKTVPHAPPLGTQVAEACRSLGLFTPGARVLVAVSAGADSTALACLLHAGRGHGLDLDLVLAHVDHGWRGAAEAAADLAVVRALAERIRAPLHVSPAPPAETPRSEDAARRWRYRCLSEVARDTGCRYVATGHHAGDQAETFLMRLLRGSGSVGLAGIPRRRLLQPGDLVVVRPLLEIEPEALRTWLTERGIAWRDDPTNRDLTRERGAIRARLAAREARGHAPTLAALARRLRRRLEIREAALEATLRDGFVHHREAGAVEMPRAQLATLRGGDLALALRLAGAPLRADSEGPWFTRRHLECFQGLLAEEGDLDLPRGLRLHVRGSRAWLAWQVRPERALPTLARRDVHAAAFDLEAFLAAGRPRAAALDAGRLGERPTLRLLQPGDRFVPFGRAQRGPTVVARWLSKRGIPALGRRGQLVLEGENGIAWVIGQRVDAAHAVGSETKTVAILRLEPAP